MNWCQKVTNVSTFCVSCMGTSFLMSLLLLGMSLINCFGWALLSRSMNNTSSMPERNKSKLGTSLVMTCHCTVYAVWVYCLIWWYSYCMNWACCAVCVCMYAMHRYRITIERPLGSSPHISQVVLTMSATQPSTKFWPSLIKKWSVYSSFHTAMHLDCLTPCTSLCQFPTCSYML